MDNKVCQLISKILNRSNKMSLRLVNSFMKGTIQHNES